MKKAPHISQAEWEIMKLLWKKSPVLAQEIIETLPARTRWAPATVKTLLNRLVVKGAVRFEKKGKSYLYASAYGEKEFREAEAASFLERVFDGALSPMLAHFVQSRRLTPEELDSLEKILRQKRKAA